MGIFQGLKEFVYPLQPQVNAEPMEGVKVLYGLFIGHEIKQPLASTVETVPTKGCRHEFIRAVAKG